MKEWSDDELDELFRKSDEEFEPTYQPSDWQDLRRRLDEADGVTGGGWLKSAAPWLVGVLLLLLVGVGVYYSGTNTDQSGVGESAAISSERKAPNQKESTTKTNPGAASSQTEISSETVQKHHAIGRQEIKESGTKDLVKKEDRVVKTLGVTKSVGTEKLPTPSTPEKVKELSRNPASVSGVRKQTDPVRERGNGAILLPKEDKAVQRIVTNNVVKNSESQLPVQKPELSAQEVGRNQIPLGTSIQTVADAQHRSQLPALSVLPLHVSRLENKELPYPAVVYSGPARSAAPTPKRTEVNVPKWSVRIGISPDISMVKMSEMMNSMNPGPAAALLVEGGIAKRWSLQTGIIRSLKNYHAPGSEYYWSWAYKQPQGPSSVDGSCTVFEVPLNIRFDISQRPLSRWFAGVGASSYKMQKEKYTYDYDIYVLNAMPGWESKTPSSWNLFSHANASVGYERFISKRLSVVAEPYVRIPLRGVGIGKVNLYSTGIWFSARYTPVFRK